jgi:archaellum component FlaC
VSILNELQNKKHIMNEKYHNVEHINPLIDTGHPDIKSYIEQCEDTITWLSENLLLLAEDVEGWEKIVSDIKEQIEYYKERDKRTRKC